MTVRRLKEKIDEMLEAGVISENTEVIYGESLCYSIAPKLKLFRDKKYDDNGNVVETKTYLQIKQED